MGTQSRCQSKLPLECRGPAALQSRVLSPLSFSVPRFLLVQFPYLPREMLAYSQSHPAPSTRLSLRSRRVWLGCCPALSALGGASAPREAAGPEEGEGHLHRCERLLGTGLSCGGARRGADCSQGCLVAGLSCPRPAPPHPGRPLCLRVCCVTRALTLPAASAPQGAPDPEIHPSSRPRNCTRRETASEWVGLPGHREGSENGSASPKLYLWSHLRLPSQHSHEFSAVFLTYKTADAWMNSAPDRKQFCSQSYRKASHRSGAVVSEVQQLLSTQEEGTGPSLQVLGVMLRLSLRVTPPPTRTTPRTRSGSAFPVLTHLHFLAESRESFQLSSHRCVYIFEEKRRDKIGTYIL